MSDDPLKKQPRWIADAYKKAMEDAQRERDELRVDSDFWSKQARTYAAERDRLRKALEEIRFLPADFAYDRIQRITREALAMTEDET